MDVFRLSQSQTSSRACAVDIRTTSWSVLAGTMTDNNAADADAARNVMM